MCGDLHVDSIWEEWKNPLLLIMSQRSYVVRILDAWKQASCVLEISKGMLLIVMLLIFTSVFGKNGGAHHY
jgi:hypothetical protein